MTMLPNISNTVLANAQQVWNDSIDQYGRSITLSNADGTVIAENVQAFCKRPKILGLFDRTEASYDQERYMVMTKVDAFGPGKEPEKFVRARWDDEDHAIISVTKVDLKGVVFGYRLLCKG